MLKNNKGFSLIELMVVVAIIAILASFAIPQYQSFQAKARQKEGVTLLGGFYTAAQATQAEINFYPGNFRAMGFNPAGQLHYRITSVNNATAVPTGHPTEADCVSTFNGVTVCGANDAPMGGTWTVAWREVLAGVARADDPALCAAAVSDTTFTACASGFIQTDSLVDTWRINELKLLENTQSGLSNAP